MTCIVAGILSLMQHLKTLQETPEYYHPSYCPHCGKSCIWPHGHYSRKSDRSKAGELNPIFIPRFFCPYCGKTCSVLPQCIPPKRWYLWYVQQLALFKLISGESLRAVSQSVQPSRSTCRRWLNWLKGRFLLQRDVLCTSISELGRSIDFRHFWQVCLEKISFEQAMLLCHQSGVALP
jgi:hypothetical protein